MSGPDRDNAVVQRPVDLHPARPSGVWTAIRRTGRAGLQAVRPLAMPFLHRFEARVRTAVWRTGLVEDVSRLNERSEATLAAVRHLVERPEARADDTSALSTAEAQQAMTAALARLEATSARQGDQLDALGRMVPNLRMTAFRIEDAVAADGKRVAMIHQALTTSVVPLEPQVGQVVEHVAALTAALGQARAEIAGLTTMLAAARQEVAGLSAAGADLAVIAETTRQYATLLVQRNTVPLPGNEVAVRTPSGYVIVPGDDAELLVYLAESGGHEAGTVKAIERLLDAGDVAIDVGAHVGLMAVPMARRVGPAGSVIAFEPSPQTAGLLRRTLSLNGLQGWTAVRQEAVSDYPSRAVLHFGHNTALHSLLPLPGADAGVEVDVVRLDDAVPSGTAVALLKIDVEGVELAVLAGMKRLLTENPGVVVIAEFASEHLTRSGSTPADWLGAFAEAGLDTALRIDEADGSCHRVTADDLLTTPATINLVLAGHSAPRLERLRPTL
ncbi:MAG: FkbM family methyltransferase [Gemmatimonadaceae bacterium]|nr:FkbM family methyltransferase [Acetobacteraceae bacterium]